MESDRETRIYFMRLEANKEFDEIQKEIMTAIKIGFIHDIFGQRRRIHVSNIPFSFRNNDLHRMFKQFGIVYDAEVIFNTRGSKGFGFLTMDVIGAYKAIEALNGHMIYGRVIEVNQATPKQSYPPKRQMSAENIGRFSKSTPSLTETVFKSPQSKLFRATGNYVRRKLFHD